MSDQVLELALRNFEATAVSFAMRLVRMAKIRSAYVEQIRQMSESIRLAVRSDQLSAGKGAKIASQLRNEILEMQRSRDFDFGRSLAKRMKETGLDFKEVLKRVMNKLGLQGQQFHRLKETQQHQVFMKVIESSGAPRESVNQAIPRMRWAARGL